MSRFVLTCLALIWASTVAARQIIPDQRYVSTQEMDFFGADRTALFDSTFDACQRACDADGQCVAFTFNSRSNTCFPKSAVTDRQPCVGARSAERILTGPNLQRAAVDGAAAG